MHKDKARTMMEAIMSSVNDTYLRSLLCMYNKEMDCVSALTESIDILYEKELEHLLQHENKLPTGESRTLVHEFDKLSKMVNLGIRSGEIQINGEVFKNLQTKFKEECPILVDIIEALFPDHTDKKEKGAMHALFSSAFEINNAERI
jgi:hypothetical protein